MLLPFKSGSKPLTSQIDSDKHRIGAPLMINSQQHLTFLFNISSKAGANFTIDQIAIPMATFQRVNACQVYAIIDANLESHPIDCRSIQDNSYVTFRFNQSIGVGIHRLDFYWNGQQGNEVALYAHQPAVPYGFPWLAIQTGERQLRVFHIYREWFSHYPWQPLLYSAVLLFLLKGFWSHERYPFLVMSGVVLMGMLIVQVPYGGFDETAHIDMMHQAFHPHENNRTSFWNSVRDDMAKSEFTLFHQASLPPPDHCPHLVIGSCGMSEGPQRLYSFYSSFLSPLRSFVDFSSPQMLRIVAYLFNVLLLASFGIVVALAGGHRAATVFGAILLFYGGIWSQLVSITNDFPMIILGLILALTLFLAVIPDRKGRALLVWFLAVFMAFVLRGVDVSIWSALPALALFFPLVILGRIGTGASSQSSRGGHKEAFQVVAAMALPIILFLTLKTVLVKDIASVGSLLKTKLPIGGYLANLEKFTEISKSFSFLWQFMKSVFGSYVWGHSYYDRWVYWGLFFLYLLLSATGVSYLFKSRSKTGAWLILVTIGLLIALQLTAVLTAYIFDAGTLDAIARDSYLKSRFTAPGVSTLLVLPAWGINALIENKSRMMILEFSLRSWCLILMGYYGAVIFWGPRVM